MDGFRDGGIAEQRGVGCSLVSAEGIQVAFIMCWVTIAHSFCMKRGKEEERRVKAEGGWHQKRGGKE